MSDDHDGPVAVTVGVPRTYRLPDVGPNRLFDDAVRDFGAHEAVVAGETVMTWGELAEVVADVGDALVDRGVQRGVLVAVGATGTIADVVVPLAVWRSGGAIAVRGVTGALPEGTHLDVGIGGAGPGIEVQVRRRTVPVLRRLRTPWSVTVTGAASAATDGEVGRVGPDVCFVTTDEHGDRLEVARHHAIATAFAVRLWVPDMQAGGERLLLAGLSHHDIVGTLLPALLGAAALVPGGEDDPIRAATDGGCTMVHVSGDRLREPADTDTGQPLRVVLHHGDAPTGVVDAIRRMTGARVAACAGPAAANFFTHAQAVYGPAVPAPGHPVTNTVAGSGPGGELVVSGPQVVGGTVRLPA